MREGRGAADELVSIVLPVYDQADHLESVVDEYEAALTRLPCRHETVLVPNGCRDDSEAIGRALAARYAEVRVVSSQRGGWGRAVKLGLSEARGSLLCYTNLARTTAQDLTLLLLYAVTFPDVVVKANRKIRDSLRRRGGSLIYNLECRALFDLSYWDINGTPKVFPRRFDRLMGLTRDDDLIDAEFALICRRADYPVIEVPIFSSKRHGGRSTTSLRSALRLYWGAYLLSRAAGAARP
jgi:glycosyltransferase involved in cell wall biosynthesis